MNGITDINLWSLLLGYIIMVIPIFYMGYYRTGLIKETFVALLRMSVQLFLVAIYLGYIFQWNNALLNSAWVVIMAGIGAFTTTKRSGLKLKYFFLPVCLSTLISLLVINAFFLDIIIGLDNVFDAQYLIPISGMILGNAMNYNIVGLNTYFDQLVKNENLYYFILINKNSKKAALEPFLREAIKKAFNPLIATISVTGLIALPGMMTGQILSGSSPMTAIKYQILIMLAIFAGCSLNLIFSILFSNRFAFDKYDNLRKEILKEKISLNK
ncbi:ABC transporter permease [Xanthovirga aplysinae]|uniref:ABC transporter permease n=1 Tax=Xanthovirga aplysinae TaxID=2529853 RepID=UPI0012BC74C1|nr:ABC transporter permease [Xanthovirga aplysinae]MTI32827.1 ABC transporter permease [Xanthovirga aplysinae]